ncbi:MAG: hypothetical protein HFE57_05355 [Firmicutes bacterium]|jgi:hypothetical protein|nr:hypothetical protein [Bacillota bacterium]
MSEKKNDMLTPPVSESFLTKKEEFQKEEQKEKEIEKEKTNVSKSKLPKVPNINKNYILFSIGICLLIVIAIVFTMNKKVKIDIQKYNTVSFYGIDGKGTANCDLNYEGVKNEIIKKEDDKKIASKTIFLNTLYTTITPNTDLSNDDEITVKVIYDKEVAKEAGITLLKDSYVVKVKDLLIAEKVDPFQGLEVSFMGTQPYGSFVVNTNQCHDFVKKYVDFSTEEDGSLSNGQKITVSATYSDYDAESAIVNIVSNQKSYTVSGLDAYLTSFDNVDFSTLKQEVSDAVEAMVAEKSDSMYFANIYLGTDGSIQKVTPKDIYLVSLKENRQKKNTFNYLYFFYEADCIESSGDYKKIYFVIEVKDVIVDSQGGLHWNTKLSYDSSKKADVLVPSLVTAKKSDYNITLYKDETTEQKQE